MLGRRGSRKHPESAGRERAQEAHGARLFQALLIALRRSSLHPLAALQSLWCECGNRLRKAKWLYPGWQSGDCARRPVTVTVIHCYRLLFEHRQGCQIWQMEIHPPS